MRKEAPFFLLLVGLICSFSAVPLVSQPIINDNSKPF